MTSTGMTCSRCCFDTGVATLRMSKWRASTTKRWHQVLLFLGARVSGEVLELVHPGIVDGQQPYEISHILTWHGLILNWYGWISGHKPCYIWPKKVAHKQPTRLRTLISRVVANGRLVDVDIVSCFFEYQSFQDWDSLLGSLHNNI